MKRSATRNGSGAFAFGHDLGQAQGFLSMSAIDSMSAPAPGLELEVGRTESLNLKNDYERACGWYGHFNRSEMALFSECTDRYALKLLDTADIVREAIFRQLPSQSLMVATANCLKVVQSGFFGFA
jgi:hypothetical protein